MSIIHPKAQLELLKDIKENIINIININMMYLILLYFFLIIKSNHNPIQIITTNANNFHMTKICQIDNYNNKCYEISISNLLLPFVLQYNKNMIKGCCSGCGYYIFINTTNISTPIGNICASIFRQ